MCQQHGLEKNIHKVAGDRAIGEHCFARRSHVEVVGLLFLDLLIVLADSPVTGHFVDVLLQAVLLTHQMRVFAAPAREFLDLLSPVFEERVVLFHVLAQVEKPETQAVLIPPLDDETLFVQGREVGVSRALRDVERLGDLRDPRSVEPF
jgi:hypothetical protein